MALKAGHSVRVIQDRLFQEHGLHPGFFLETDNMETAQQIALRCGCYLLCPDSYLPPERLFIRWTAMKAGGISTPVFAKKNMSPSMQRPFCISSFSIPPKEPPF